ncbi:MAG: hypothetical protein QOE50_1107 [Sphingomonadales bacterium]|nr:hypothetical protein [Sphingomonadales bacterium]
MTQQASSPQSTERLTSRQRRIEEQRKKIDAARGEQRRKRMVWGAIILVVVAAAVAALILLMPHSTASASMRQVVTETATHVDEGAPLSYRNRPPSSGVHYGTLPQPAEYRMWDTPLSPGRWVHMLEHGAVAVLYRPDLCDATCVQALGEFYDAAPRSSVVPGVRHLVITPYQDMDHAVAVVAWGYVDEMDQMDKDRVMADFKSKVDASTAPERGAL